GGIQDRTPDRPLYRCISCGAARARRDPWGNPLLSGVCAETPDHVLIVRVHYGKRGGGKTTEILAFGAVRKPDRKYRSCPGLTPPHRDAVRDKCPDKARASAIAGRARPAWPRWWPVSFLRRGSRAGSGCDRG